jgi:hypothetical protein
MLRHRFAVLAALCLAALQTTSSPQAGCFVPDGLNGPCWMPANALLPNFPTITLPSTSICWINCTPTQVCADMTVGAPVMVRCGVYNAPLMVSDCAGLGLLSAGLNLDYTRTWMEVDPAGIGYQVWRFVVKADVRAIPPIMPSCTVPPCLGAHPTAFYYGYLDYAKNCSTGQFEAALVLFHNCDRFIHDPLFSNRPGAFHPGTSYALVGPSTAANPFVAMAAVAPAGMIVAEAVRNVPPPGAALCFTEDPVNGAIQFIINGCVCPFALNPKQTTARILRATGTCVDPMFGPTNFTTVNPMNPFPWLHDITTAIGTWTSPTGPYPGPEFVWVDEAPVLYRDSCPKLAYGELYYGASTSKGFTVVPTTPGPMLTQNFTDLASNASWTPPGAPVFPFAGTALATRNLIYLNVP